MGLLPDTHNCGLRMRRECRERFLPPPTSKETARKWSWHASRHVRDARAVMHVGIAYQRWRGKRSRHSRRMRTRNFTYLARGQCQHGHHGWNWRLLSWQLTVPQGMAKPAQWQLPISISNKTPRPKTSHSLEVSRFSIWCGASLLKRFGVGILHVIF